MINTAADTAAELGESKSNVAKELKERLKSIPAVRTSLRTTTDIELKRVAPQHRAFTKGRAI
jgi:hypothetical protein